MKKTLLSTLALAVMLLGAGQASAQDKPAAVLSVTSYDTLMKDVDFVGALGDAPDLSKGLDGLIAFVTQGKGLKGFDKSKPIGVAVYLNNGPMPTVLAFVPVTDLKALLALVQNQQIAITESAGVYEWKSPVGQSVFATQKGGWAIISSDQAALSKAPADPEKVLDGLDKKYAVALRVNVQSIPKEMRDQVTFTLRSAAEASLRQGPNEDPASFELRRKMTQNQLDQIDVMMKELDQFTLGWAIDPSAKKTYIDISATGVSGSEIAASAARLANTTSNYAGFQLPGSAANLNFSSKFGQQEIDQASAMLKTLRDKMSEGIDKDASIPDGDAKTQVKALAGEFMDVIENTVKSGKLDGGATLTLDPNALSFAFGGYVKDGPALEAALKKLVAMGAGDPNFPKVTLDAETYKGIKMSTMNVPIQNNPDAQKMFGDTLDVSIGIGNQSFYAAIGKGGLALVKKVIDASAAAPSQAGPPMQLNIALTPIITFANAQHPDPAAGAALQALSAASGKDHIRLTETGISNGVNIRLEAEEGVLKAIATAVKAGAGGGRAGGPPPGARPFGN